MTRPAQGSTLPSDRDRVPGLSGGFVEDGGDTWYRIDGIESTPPFFVALAGDSDLWVFASTAGSLTAGRRDPDGAFFPYETVDKLHRRWDSTTDRAGYELYDVEADTTELHDLADDMPERVDTMKQQLEAWQQSVIGSLKGDDYRVLVK